ncbi:MAG: D-alanyl-D-alanine carboxypeptidase/D-alanyl-D-alanine-endopeptidase [Myxococcota bacterium]|nr:D-alanyl-D-alanine carboxypeptidase/D-alanyl-D-alanine-endopeptidase [Myxococcota bacterium]
MKPTGVGRVLAWVWVLAMLWGVAPRPGFAAPDTPPAPAPLATRLDALLAAGPLAEARVGALIVEVGSGDVLYARHPEAPRVPASNLKLFTALAALDALGPSHRFETVIRADPGPGGSESDGLVGRLGVVGGGDPALNSEDWWRLAADLRQRGLRRVEGDLVVDPSHFDSEYWHPDWGQPSSRAYHAPVAGLSANYGAFFVRVTPGASPGDAVRVEIDPPLAYLEIQNRAVTGPAGSADSLVVGRGPADASSETIAVSGGLARDRGARTFARSVRDPALYAGALFEMQLAALGIDVGGRVRRGEVKTGEEWLRYRGRPLSEIVGLFLKYSNNSMAESLVKSLAAGEASVPGNWSSGLKAMRQRLTELGVLGPGAVLADGSGLSPRNRVSARMVVDALRLGADSFRFGPEFMAALPLGGRDGTLERRMPGALDRVRAKTGLLKSHRVVALSGFAERAEGKTVIFSILVNGYAGSAHAAMQAVDAWLEALVKPGA